jgi:hypothetical protein
MPLFRRGPKAARTPPPPAAAQPSLTLDPALGDPDAAQLIAAMAAGDWPTARRLLTAGYDPDDLAFMMGAASGVPGSESWLPAAIREDLDDPLPLLLYGLRAIDWAWEARTRKQAKYVTREQFEVFFDRLRLADDCLQDVVRRDPDNTAAWTGLITLARGLELGIDEGRRRFDRVVAVHPTNVGAHWQLLQQLCEKWAGSHELMHEFARQAVAAAPAGSALGSLIPIAHLEQWLRTENERYFSSRQVLTDLHAAADRSVRHPDYRQSKGWPRHNNWFAMAFALAGDQPAAAEQFRVIGDLVTQLPWAYERNDPIGVFLAYRQRAYAAAG